MSRIRAAGPQHAPTFAGWKTLEKNQTSEAWKDLGSLHVNHGTVDFGPPLVAAVAAVAVLLFVVDQDVDSGSAVQTIIAFTAHERVVSVETALQGPQIFPFVIPKQINLSYTTLNFEIHCRWLVPVIQNRSDVMDLFMKLELTRALVGFAAAV